MTDMDVYSQESFAPRAPRRRPVLRVVAWAMFWTTLAHISWLAFKAAQVRLQPDAIASGLPGFLFRLVIQPLDWIANSVHSGEAASVALQLCLAVTICVAAARSQIRRTTAFGGAGADLTRSGGS